MDPNLIPKQTPPKEAQKEVPKPKVEKTTPKVEKETP